MSDELRHLRNEILALLTESGEKRIDALNTIREWLHELSPESNNPVDFVRWIPISKIMANDYNPNNVAKIEMRLLHTSISHDGYTQPIVTVYDALNDKYIIVDGFHRYFVAKTNKDIFDSCNGMLPVVVINKDINDRMASTIRHNRARGKHQVTGMSNMVFEMLDNGWSDAEICNELGMEAEEIIKLKHITGFSKLFANAEYSKAWETKRQIQIRLKYEEEESSKSGTT